MPCWYVALAWLDSLESCCPADMRQPVVLPLLLLAQRRLAPESAPFAELDHSFPGSILVSVRAATLIAVFVVAALTGCHVTRYAASMVPAAALLLAYVAFDAGLGGTVPWIPAVDLDHAINPLAKRVVCLLTAALVIESFVFGLPSANPASVLILGAIQILSWFFTISAVGSRLVARCAHAANRFQARRTSWGLAAALQTFGVLTARGAWMQSTEDSAFALAAASFLTLGQIVYLLPGQATARWRLWCLAALPLMSCLVNVHVVRVLALLPMESPMHPVERLIQQAQTSFEEQLKNQSSTYAAAASEYRRRYAMEPPPGFEGWYRFAVAAESPIIDDFDTMYHSISPLWKLSGGEITQAMQDVYQAPDSDIFLCNLSAKHDKMLCEHPSNSFDRHIRGLFNAVLRDVRKDLPDVSFLINHLDEPRVSIPHATQGSGGSRNVTLANMARQATWNTITQSCAEIKSRGRADLTYGLPFIADAALARDLCQHPEYETMHGFFMNPSSFRLIEGLLPVLSMGAPSSMGDIVFPSPAYQEPEFQYREENDVEWDRKRNNLYWKGSTTGGFASDGRWQNYHRQRLVSFVQNPGFWEKDQRYKFLQEEDGMVYQMQSSFLDGRLFDVGFSRIFQCGRRACRDESRFFETEAWAPRDEALQSRLVFDLDGNGISGRYYKLLASRSVPLKQTLLREWHDDRLRPWVHYVPVSPSLEELPELVNFLTSTPTGQRRAREIADRGRAWFGQAMRDVDMTVYLYRLLLELARLQDARRPAS